MIYCTSQNYSYISNGGARFDILKFVLAMFIVAMHSGFFPRWLLPISRLAVPLFFIMTSYFFHIKLKDVVDKSMRKELLIKYVKRNLWLYLFWSIVLLPGVVLLHLSWFRNGLVGAFLNVIKSFFITGFFPASWFVLSSVYAVVIVFVLSKRLNNRWIFFISFLVYIIALLDSNYGGLLSEEAKNYFNVLDIRHSLNLPAAMIWVVIGKQLAEKPVTISIMPLYSLLIIAAALYYLEFFLIEHYDWSVHTDCFLMSIPLCALIFITVGQGVDIKCKQALVLRKSSIIIYCLHLTIIQLLRMLSTRYIELPKIVIYAIALFISVGVAYLIVFLREKKGVKLLKYSY